MGPGHLTQRLDFRNLSWWWKSHGWLLSHWLPPPTHLSRVPAHTHSHNSPSHVIILVLGLLGCFFLLFKMFLFLLLSHTFCCDTLISCPGWMSWFQSWFICICFSTAKQQAIYYQFPDNGVWRHVIQYRGPVMVMSCGKLTWPTCLLEVEGQLLHSFLCSTISHVLILPPDCGRHYGGKVRDVTRNSLHLATETIHVWHIKGVTRKPALQ